MSFPICPRWSDHKWTRLSTGVNVVSAFPQSETKLLPQCAPVRCSFTMNQNNFTLPPVYHPLIYLWQPSTYININPLHIDFLFYFFFYYLKWIKSYFFEELCAAHWFAPPRPSTPLPVLLSPSLSLSFTSKQIDNGPVCWGRTVAKHLFFVNSDGVHVYLRAEQEKRIWSRVVTADTDTKLSTWDWITQDTR